jgi:5S rRNA maturation endonuclease (ribonuclease M5)
MNQTQIQSWLLGTAKVNFTSTSGTQWLGHAPYREDKRPSFSVNIVNGLWHDHATKEGGNLQQLAKRMNLPMLDFMKTNTNNNGKKSKETVYPYKDENGNLLYEAVRIDKPDGKIVFQRQPDGKGGYKKNAQGKYRVDKNIRLVIYKLPEIIERCRQGETKLCIVEGEKCADLMSSLGFTVTCNVRGAGSWIEAYNEQVPEEIEEVYIFPDFDKPGIRHAEQIANSLSDMGFIVKLILLGYEIKENHGDDVFDFIKRDGHTKEDILEIIENTPPYSNDLNNTTFPIEAIPRELRSFMATAAKSISRPVDFIFVPSLAILGSAIGSNVKVEIKEGWEEKPILFTAVIGDSGSGKSPGQKIAKEPVLLKQSETDKEYKQRQIKAYIAWKEYEEEKKLLNKEDKQNFPKPNIEKRVPSPPVYFAVDVTTEALASYHQDNPRGLIQILDELKGLINSLNQYKGGKGNDRQFILSLHNGGEISVLRKGGNGKGDGRERITIPETCISITGGIQPSEISAIIGDNPDLPSDGFAPRFLMAFPDYSLSFYNDSAVLPKVERERYREIYEKVFDFGNSGRVLRFSPKAKLIWEYVYNKLIIERITGDMPAILNETWMKMITHSARITLIFHIIRVVTEGADENEIDETSIYTAWKLVEYFKAHARKIYNKASGDSGNNNFRKVIECLKNKGNKLTARDIRRSVKLGDTKAVHLILDAMVENGFLTTSRDGKRQCYSLSRKYIETEKL